MLSILGVDINVLVSSGMFIPYVHYKALFFRANTFSAAWSSSTVAQRRAVRQQRAPATSRAFSLRLPKYKIRHIYVPKRNLRSQVSTDAKSPATVTLLYSVQQHVADHRKNADGSTGGLVQGASRLPVAEVLAGRKKCLSWAMCFHFGFLNLVTIARHGVYGTILTGNTILAASSGSKLDFVSVGFYLLVILFYLSGKALYWIIDIKLDHRTSAGVLAPLVFVLYSLTDVLDYIATDGSFSRTDAAVLKANQWNLLPVAVGAGCISACGAHIDAVISNMITGHYNIIVSAYVTYYASGRRGLPDARKKACLVSIGCVASFSSGACLSAALSIHVGTDWQLCGLGLFAAVLLKLHDYVHKDTFDKLKESESPSVLQS